MLEGAISSERATDAARKACALHGGNAYATFYINVTDGLVARSISSPGYFYRAGSHHSRCPRFPGTRPKPQRVIAIRGGIHDVPVSPLVPHPKGCVNRYADWFTLVSHPFASHGP